jgi:hypothetical protein
VILTFLEMQTEVFQWIDEDSADPAFWTVDDVKTAINEGYGEISDSSEWYERDHNLPLLSNRTYYDLRSALGGEPVLTFKHAFNQTTRRWLYPGEIRELDYRTFNQWEEITGEPEQFFVRGLFWLGTFPKQSSDSGTMKAYFTALPPDLSADGDTPGCPDEFHYGIVEYAIGDLLSQEAETQKAIGHFGEYSTYEAGLKGWVDGRVALDRIPMLNG